jgi:hypothetical protein
MSSFVGTGVAAIVVFIVAVEIGPTKRSQNWSKLSPMEVEKAVGFTTMVPPTDVDLVGVGMIEIDVRTFRVTFWEATRPARIKIENVLIHIFTDLGVLKCYLDI